MNNKIEVFTTVEAKENHRTACKDYAVEAVTPFQMPQDAGEWMQRAAGLRKALIDFYLRGHPDGIAEARPAVEWTDTIETGAGYRIRKLRFEGYPGIMVPALLYEPEDLTDPAPAVLNPNGHHDGGKAMVYKQARCINLAKRGMLALNFEFLGMGELSASRRHWNLAHLELLGVNGAGIFYLIMRRALDILCSHALADPARIAVTGLSGGGWQTVLLSALDERVRVSIPVAGHSPVKQRAYFIEDIGDPEQLPADLCTIADFDTITALIAPRPLLLIYNEKDDCCFRPERTVESVYEPVQALYDFLGAGDDIGLHINIDPGTHNYEADNRSQLYKFLNKHFRITSPETDIPFEDELLSEVGLSVGIPPGNADILGLARAGSLRLRKNRKSAAGDAAPGTQAAEGGAGVNPAAGTAVKPGAGTAGPGTEDAQTRRDELRCILRVHEFAAEGFERVVEDDTAADPVPILLRCDNGPDIPLLYLPERQASSEGTEKSCRIFISDEGKDAVFSEPGIGSGKEGSQIPVYALDLLGFGESRPFAENKYQYHLVLSASGRPSLGVLTAQITAAARRLKNDNPGTTVELAARGLVSMLAALCAAALEPGLFSRIETSGLPDSLHRLIDWPVLFEEAAPLFCFGLLERFDLPDLIRLAGTRSGAGRADDTAEGGKREAAAADRPAAGESAAAERRRYTAVITDSQRGILQ